MSMEHHRHFNKLLNEVVTFSASMPPAEHVTYRHQKEIDYFFDEHIPETGRVEHLRVTRDAQTLQVKPGGIVSKQRIADINIHSPNHPFDFRISINTEMPMPPPPEDSQPVFVREKDRLSYANQNVNVDLTQVILPSRVGTSTHSSPNNLYMSWKWNCATQPS